MVGNGFFDGKADLASLQLYDSLPMSSDLDKIKNGPAANAPPGIIPNYANPPNDNRLALAVIGLSVGVAVLAGLLRVYSKFFCTSKVKLKPEDYIGLTSFVIILRPLFYPI
ncbi:hypothetical protein CIB48_g9774 [Xylaria polymorpha]|nr:hypothetical protein CIB48_g9774 [Xylaria polymorpha]